MNYMAPADFDRLTELLARRQQAQRRLNAQRRSFQGRNDLTLADKLARLGSRHKIASLNEEIEALIR